MPKPPFATALAALMIGLAPSLAAGDGIDLTPPSDVTPEIIAMRGCIEGVAHPQNTDLDVDAQRAACDAYVALYAAPEEGWDHAVFARARFLADTGRSRADLEQAYTDFSALIEAGTSLPGHYARRATLGVHLYQDLDQAHADISQAIDLREARDAERERPSLAGTQRYLQIRILLRMTIAHRDGDTDLLYGAATDLATLLRDHPGDTVGQEAHILLAECFADMEAGEAADPSACPSLM